MSRHRFVRNLDIDDERDDGALSDGGDDMTPEQQAQLEAGLDRVRAVIGDEMQSGFTDSIIEDTLWDCYFDESKTVEWLLEEQTRRNAARERKEERSRLGLPFRPDSPPEASGISGAQLHASLEYLAHTRAGSSFTSLPNAPLIVNAQQEFYEASEVPGSPTRLSTITERTELTVTATDVPRRGSRHTQNDYQYIRPSVASVTTDSSYGQVIESQLGNNRRSVPMDPNVIPPSPPKSAMRLSSHVESQYLADEREESVSSRTPLPGLSSVSLPPTENIPDIPDTQSKSSRPHALNRQDSLNKAIPVDIWPKQSPSRGTKAVNKPLPPLPPPSEPRYSVAESLPLSEHPKRSKLSALASSRAASTRLSTFTKSSRMSASTIGTSSVLTFPNLRPSAESELSFSPEEDSGSTTSSLVRRAIQTALIQEAVDRTASPQREDKEVQYALSERNSASSGSTARPKDTISRASSSNAQTSGNVATTPKDRQPSKLAKLAQAKSKQQGPWSPKLKPPPHSLLHSSHTEYLTPIANGPTATTAITTSYQTLDHLISPARSALPPSFPPSSNSIPSTSPVGEKPSKLAMKARKSKQKTVEDERAYLPVPTMFLPETNRSRASPSDFASLLVKRELLTKVGHQGGKGERREKTGQEPRSSRSRSRTRHHRKGSEEHKSAPIIPDEFRSKAKRSSSSKAHPRHHGLPDPSIVSQKAFAFDVPSPDEVVFNARKGTSMAKSVASTATILPPSTISSRSPTSSVSTWPVTNDM
ncbi:hypothetical protein FA95DRAFT_1260810 [Auriscalpium vulgare]|uniref:Uncharacterized protein n=1 Tax=Auriscalpium vulgare TaxID=40419 RepID=A0ACB8RTM3_9AGAM|nr:hypothetical protein FA95DRAFT_1260810 [Auriscalpium vulgare]